MLAAEVQSEFCFLKSLFITIICKIILASGAALPIASTTVVTSLQNNLIHIYFIAYLCSLSYPSYCILISINAFYNKIIRNRRVYIHI